MKQFEVVNEPIQTEKYREFVLNEHQGAIVVFTGHVREWTKGIKTEYLEYEAYIPMAEKKLAQIGDEIEARWPGTITTIVHRIGPLQISDIAVLIAVSSPHRLVFVGKAVPEISEDSRDKKLSSIVKALRPSMPLCAKTML